MPAILLILGAALILLGSVAFFGPGPTGFLVLIIAAVWWLLRKATT